MVNPNHYNRKWKITYRKNKWQQDDKEEFVMEGNFMDVLKKLQEIGRNGIYTEFHIMEVDK